MPKPEASGALYRYRDPEQGWVFTNDLEAIPEAARDTVQRFVPQADVGAAAEEGARRLRDDAERALEELPAKARALGRRSKREAEAVQREVGDVLPFVRDLDLPSVAVGFAGALLVWVASSMLRRTGRLLFKVGAFALVVALVAGAYFGWLRRAAGLGEGRLSTPKAIVDDARKAADDMQDRLQKNERLLRQLEENPR